MQEDLENWFLKVFVEARDMGEEQKLNYVNTNI